MELIKDIDKIKFHSRQTPEQLRELEECKIKIEDLINKDLPETISICKLYCDLAIKYHSKKYYAESLYFIGAAQYLIGDKEAALLNCNKSISFCTSMELKCRILICLGAIHTYYGEFGKAIEAYNTALSTSNTIETSTVYNNIATIYFKQKEYSKAIEYFDKAIALSANNKDSIMLFKNNIGRSYIELNDQEDAELILFEVKSMLCEIENPTQEMINDLNIGLLYHKQCKFDQAYKMLSAAYNKCKKLQLLNHLYSATFFLAQACSKNHMPDQANLYFIEAMELVRNSDKRLYINTLKDYIEFLTEQEDYVKASKYFKEYDQVKDRIIQEEKEKEINELSIKFRNTEQKLEIEKLTKEKEMQSTLIAQAEEIKRYNEELVLSNAHLSQANNQLMETKILRSQMNPHFVYNTLNSISSLIKSKQNKAADQYLHVFSNLTRRIFDNNTQSSISLFEELDFCAQYILLEKLRFGDKINYVQTIDPAINIESIHIPSMIIQPLLENAIKHGVFHLKKKQIGIIQLNIQQQKEQLLFEIIDNGVGIEGSIDQLLQNKKESAIHIVNKRINIYNQQDLDSQSLLIENTGSAGLKCSFNLNLNNNPYDQPNFSSR